MKPHGAITSTYNQPTCPQKENYSKDVNHTGSKDSIPCSKKHWFPNKKIYFPPRFVRHLITLRGEKRTFKFLNKVAKQ